MTMATLNKMAIKSIKQPFSCTDCASRQAFPERRTARIFRRGRSSRHAYPTTSILLSQSEYLDRLGHAVITRSHVVDEMRMRRNIEEPEIQALERNLRATLRHDQPEFG